MKEAFSQIIGQNEVKNLLVRALESQSLSHGYLFEGPAGLGKRKTAVELASAILCREEEAPCGRCSSCRQVEAGTHAEFRWIQAPQEGKETVVSVEMIRSLIRDIYLKPYEGDHKIYVVPEAETMTPQAQNALLKTLEEPPDHSVMILVSAQPERLLPTIRSRCQRLVFRPVSRQAIQLHLQDKKGIPEDKAISLAAFANGVPERALEMLENEASQQRYRQFLQLTDSLIQGQYALAMEKGEFLQQEKNQTLWVLAIWQEWLRDLQILLMEGGEELLIHRNQLERLRKQASAYSAPVIKTGMLMLETAQEDLRNYGNLSFVVESLLINLVRLLKEPAEADELAGFLNG